MSAKELEQILDALIREMVRNAVRSPLDGLPQMAEGDN